MPDKDSDSQFRVETQDVRLLCNAERADLGLLVRHYNPKEDPGTELRARAAARAATDLSSGAAQLFASFLVAFPRVRKIVFDLPRFSTVVRTLAELADGVRPELEKLEVTL